ncbi:MAG: PAS domain-containing protein [Planctomycetes bacterium]|nr:PAS domain-containing protein [Planctomycetota bacterium]
MPEVTQRQCSSRLLIVEDDEAQLRTLTAIMQDEGFEVIGCLTAAAALEHVERDDIGVAVLDLCLPDLHGTQLLEKLRARRSRINVVINTAYASLDSAKDALNLGAFAYVEKAGDPEELIRHVYRAFRTRLVRYTHDLEDAVAERMRDLQTANQMLKQEIAERKRAEHALRHEQQLLQILMDSVPDTIYFKDRESRFTRVNRAQAHVLGLEHPDQAAGKHDRDFFPCELADQYHADEQRVVATGEPLIGKTEEVTRADGGLRWLSTTKVPIRDAAGETVGTVGISRDITEHKRADEALEEALYDLDERVREVTCMNKAAQSIREHRTLEEVFVDVARLIPSAWQCPEIARGKVHFDGQEFVSDRFEETEWKQTADILVAGERRGSVEVYYLERRPDQDEGPFLDEERRFINEIARALGEAVERKWAEERIRQHQAELAHISRLSTLGEMAAGIAHGLNQPLFAVLTYAEACRLAISSGRKTPDQVLSDLERISAAATEAGEIVRRLRNFVRKREPSRSTVDVNSLIQSSTPFIEDDIAPNGIQLRLELEPRLPTVLADSLLLQQVVLNLARNAIDAMKCRNDGERELLIRTSTAGSETIEVVVRDTGPGLSAESVDKLFEPFFTTKAHGLGLGLSLSRSLVEAEGGRLVAEQNPDRGMTFRFTLPVCAGDPDDGA